MPVDDQRLQFFLVGVAVMSAKEQLSTVKLDADVSLRSTHVTTIVCN